VNAKRAKTVAEIEQEQVKMTAYINKQKNDTIKEFNADREKLDKTLSLDLAVIAQKREDELNEITRKGEETRLAIVKEGNARIAAVQGGSPQAGSPPANLPVPGFNFSVPHLAGGGIVSAPTFALIGENGPEAVVPLSAGAQTGSSAPSQNVTVYCDVHIGNVTAEVPLEEVTRAVKRGLVEGLNNQGVILA
jgi:hypothetical protein